MALARKVRFAEPLLSSVLEVPRSLGRLAEVKLEQETSAHQPSLRRCLGHYGVFQKCLNAAQEIAESASVRDECPPKAPPKSPLRPQSPSETSPARPNITSAIKGIITRRSASAPALENGSTPEPENNELSRVQARGNSENSRISRSHKVAPKMFLGLNPFARYKHKDKPGG
ncbi:uncharacterized protein BDV14DRAFT_154546 [Aspergillus stella-maris]|uniref:uncharacterized protein n=1 Tax=Aspergillus stella-maris TaxID=1810926 RepID=UPI003CCCEDED